MTSHWARRWIQSKTESLSWTRYILQSLWRADSKRCGFACWIHRILCGRKPYVSGTTTTTTTSSICRSTGQVIRCVHQFIDQKVHRYMGNIWNQNLNFIVKSIPNQRVFRTITKNLSEFRLLLGWIHKKGNSYYLCSLIVSSKFYH